MPTHYPSVPVLPLTYHSSLTSEVWAQKCRSQISSPESRSDRPSSRGGKSPHLTLSGRTKPPYPGGHVKRRTPPTVPSFLPSGSSYLTPTHHPRGSPATSLPTNMTSPRLSPGSTEHLAPTVTDDASAAMYSGSVVGAFVGGSSTPLFLAISFSRVQVGSSFSLPSFHLLYVFSRLLYSSSLIRYLSTSDTSSSQPPADADAGSVSTTWIV
mmetsp:Transcript_27233/g.69348  ORF Transcript_27233/g.69348 Transcript_27233/m.69348 type:complete len:211 (-) Transcript_27233:380-1012(-)